MYTWNSLGGFSSASEAPGLIHAGPLVSLFEKREMIDTSVMFSGCRWGFVVVRVVMVEGILLISSIIFSKNVLKLASHVENINDG